uniref:Complex III subunit 7 n=1 Tax=Kwoniella dejecticola CBS 10117 TaxID=1296121 RepID=A0A1A5ZU58_9TREE|nr:uncharacterized protein I303_08113 [Kwoniella dejecticola CBS 10117]OBR81343.1 hypothetical protein I303_08113 [Kwoniella dejecticola CBS 10117]
MTRGKSGRQRHKTVTWRCGILGYAEIPVLVDVMGVSRAFVADPPFLLRLQALSRLSAKQRYDRVFRMRRGLTQSMAHKNLPKEQWIKADEDVRYLTPLIEQVVAEEAERAEWDYMTVEKIQQKRAEKRNIFSKREGTH